MSRALPRYALIIGVNDYSAFDASAGQPIGTSDLRAPLRDALGYARIAARAGTPLGNIRLLQSRTGQAPLLDRVPLPAGLALPEPQDLPLPQGLTVGQATREEILEGLRWLAGKLGEVEGSIGLLSFSGHGAQDGQDLLLCTSDTTLEERQLVHAVRFQDIDEILGEVSQRSALTVFLETCHAAGARRRKAMARAIATQPLSETLAQRALRLDAAILTACAPHEQSLEMPFGTGYRGAFSLALEMVLERFSTGEEGLPYVISGEALIARVSNILTAQGLLQRPQARGRRERDRAAVLAARGTEVPCASGLERLLPQELWPDSTEPGVAIYKLQLLKDGAAFGSSGFVLVTGSQNVKINDKWFGAKRSYWYYPKNGSTKVNPFTAGLSFTLDANQSGVTINSDTSNSKADAEFSSADFSGTSGSHTFTLTSGTAFRVSVTPPAPTPDTHLYAPAMTSGKNYPPSLSWWMVDANYTAGGNTAPQAVSNPAPVLTFTPETLPTSQQSYGWKVKDDNQK